MRRIAQNNGYLQRISFGVHELMIRYRKQIIMDWRENANQM